MGLHIIVVNRDVDRSEMLYGLVPVSEVRTFFISLCNSPVTFINSVPFVPKGFCLGAFYCLTTLLKLVIVISSL